ncbi:hypothetical protein ACCO45_000532 [Purpureocillium lilacinum]|uniref:Uncharacterized protein n=1 Tax=Purpureocillium lilacinum TaxID=33203 RepID=A0ACC4E5N3_PURLI
MTESLRRDAISKAAHPVASRVESSEGRKVEPGRLLIVIQYGTCWERNIDGAQCLPNRGLSTLPHRPRREPASQQLEEALTAPSTLPQLAVGRSTSLGSQGPAKCLASSFAPVIPVPSDLPVNGVPSTHPGAGSDVSASTTSTTAATVLLRLPPSLNATLNATQRKAARSGSAVALGHPIRLGPPDQHLGTQQGSQPGHRWGTNLEGHQGHHRGTKPSAVAKWASPISTPVRISHHASRADASRATAAGGVLDAPRIAPVEVPCLPLRFALRRLARSAVRVYLTCCMPSIVRAPDASPAASCRASARVTGAVTERGAVAAAALSPVLEAKQAAD